MQIAVARAHHTHTQQAIHLNLNALCENTAFALSLRTQTNFFPLHFYSVHSIYSLVVRKTHFHQLCFTLIVTFSVFCSLCGLIVSCSSRLVAAGVTQEVHISLVISLLWLIKMTLVTATNSSTSTQADSILETLPMECPRIKGQRYSKLDWLTTWHGAKTLETF